MTTETSLTRVVPSDESVIDLDGPIDLSGLALDEALHLYGQMRLIRNFEDRVNKLFLQGLIPGTIHLSFGQEACAVGGADLLAADDWITITHRGHGQALAKGVAARALMAELFARDTGCCRGWGGSLHVGDVSVGALPAIAIVGAAVPIAAGLAFASKERGGSQVTVCFFGDGAMNEGDTHEGLNLAALWELPVVYLCENNLYSVSTPTSRQNVVQRVATRAASYGIRACTVDGNNVVAVRDAVHEAVDHARAGGGPSLVECLTYRQGGHKRDDPATYRPQEEVALWLRRDPIERMRAALDALGESIAADKVDAEAIATIDDAVEFARNSPPAKPLEIH